MFSLFIEWTVSPELFPDTAFSRVRWYGLCWALGFYIGFYLLRKIFKVESKNLELVDSYFLYVFAGSILGARLGHCLFYGPYWDEYSATGALIRTGYLSRPWEMLYIWEGGLASHGGLIGILVATYLFAKKNSLRFMWLLDRFIIPGALACSLIRVGNLFNHEIIGDITTKAWGFYFRRANHFDKVNNVLFSKDPRHPTQLYEAIAYAITFAILYYVWNKSKSSTKPGLLAGLFFALAGFARVVIEDFKVKQADHNLFDAIDLSTGQILSVPVVLTGLYLIFVYKEKSTAK